MDKRAPGDSGNSVTGNTPSRQMVMQYALSLQELPAKHRRIGQCDQGTSHTGFQRTADPQLPMYDELKNYDEPNRGPSFQDPAVQWYMRYVADTLAKGFVNGLLAFKNVPVETLPISPEVAVHLLKVKDVESDYDKACWAAGLYRLSIMAPDAPVGNTGKSLSNLMHDLIDLPRPGSQSNTCKYLK